MSSVPNARSNIDVTPMEIIGNYFPGKNRAKTPYSGHPWDFSKVSSVTRLSLDRARLSAKITFRNREKAFNIRSCPLRRDVQYGRFYCNSFDSPIQPWTALIISSRSDALMVEWIRYRDDIFTWRIKCSRSKNWFVNHRHIYNTETCQIWICRLAETA